MPQTQCPRRNALACVQGGQKQKAPPFTQEDSSTLEELAEYAGMVMAALVRGKHKERHLQYAKRLDILSSQFLQVCPSSEW